MSILPDSGRGDVFALPDRMPGKLRHVRHSCTVFGGLAGAGEVGADTLQAMANLVPCGYPALTTGNARLQYLAAPTTGAAHGLTLHRGKVVLAQGTGLFVSSGAGACTRLGNVTDTDKRFASFGDLLFILRHLLPQFFRRGGGFAYFPLEFVMLCGQAFQLLTVRFKGGFLFFVSVDFPGDGI